MRVRNGLHVRQSAEVRKNIYNILNMVWIYFLQKRMDLLQEAFIHPLELCEAHFTRDVHVLFDYFWTVEQKHLPTHIIKLGRARTFFNITPIGLVWKKKVMETDSEEKKLLNKVFFFLCAKKYSRSFIKLRLNHWCNMDYFNDILPYYLSWTCNGGKFALLSMQGQKALRFHQNILIVVQR